MLGFITLPLFIPDIVLGISLLLLLSAVGIPAVAGERGAGPSADLRALRDHRADRRASRASTRSLEEASLDLGENGWMTFWRVTFPLMLPGIVASLLLTFIVSFDEFLLAYFLSGTEATLPIYIWGQLRFPDKLPMVLALGALILAGVGGAGGDGRMGRAIWVRQREDTMVGA